MYIDKLRGVAPDGSVHYTYHKRLKGITDDAITEKYRKTQKNWMNITMSGVYSRT